MGMVGLVIAGMGVEEVEGELEGVLGVCVEVGNVDFKYLNWNFLFFLQVMNDGLE
jgi:hypothetical protein